MATRDEEQLGTYTQWAQAFSPKDLADKLRDQAILHRGQLNDGNEYTRYTPAQPPQRTADTTRASRDDLEFRDWNSEHGFNGAARPLSGPGMVGQAAVSASPAVAGQESDGQKRRRARREKLDDGF